MSFKVLIEILNGDKKVSRKTEMVLTDGKTVTGNVITVDDSGFFFSRTSDNKMVWIPFHAVVLVQC
jgi:myosin-crossreactive antigen